MSIGIATKRSWPWVLGILALLMLGAVLPSYHLRIVTLALLYGYLAATWNIIGGYTGQFSLANSAFIGLGAYTSTYLYVQFKLTPWVGMWAGAVTAGLLGVGFGYLCFRVKMHGKYFALCSLALAEIVFWVIFNIPALGQSQGLEVPYLPHTSWIGLQLADRRLWYYLMLALVGLIVGAGAYLTSRKPGVYLRAIKEDETAASALGINVLAWKVGAFGASAALGAIGGTMYAQMIGVIEPFSLLSLNMMVQVLICAIIGGVGTAYGPVLGALVLIPAGQALRIYLGGSFFSVQFMVYGALLILFTLKLPGGLASLIPRVHHDRSNSTEAKGGAVHAE